MICVELPGIPCGIMFGLCVEDCFWSHRTGLVVYYDAALVCLPDEVYAACYDLPVALMAEWAFVMGSLNSILVEQYLSQIMGQPQKYFEKFIMGAFFASSWLRIRILLVTLRV